MPGIDVGALRSQFIADVDAGRVPVVAGCADQASWWVRSVRLGDSGLVLIVDDGDGSLISVPLAQAGGSVTYGRPELIRHASAYSAFAASATAEGQRILASWSTPAASRPSTTGGTMEIDSSKLAQDLGLSPNADVSLIRARLRGLVGEREVKAVAASQAQPARPSAALTPEAIQAKSTGELQSLVCSAYGSDRTAVEDELAHRAFMQGSFPGERRPGESSGLRVHRDGS